MKYAGVELGGTKCVVILASGPENIVAREVIPTTAPDETLARIEQLLLRWKDAHDFSALGVASFGPIDVDPASPRYGVVLATPKPGWPDTDVGRRLTRAAGVPTVVDTDVNGAALAEMRWGSGRGSEDFAYVTVGTGVGVGLIVAGEPTRGFGHCELGHVRVARLPGDEWAGSCPYHRDCVEGLASGSALRARFGARLDEIAADHPVWDSVAWTLGQLCHAIVCAAAPRRIAFGGGVIDRHPHLLARIEDKLIESLGGFIELPPDRPYVRAPELGANAGPLGAIALAAKAKP
jgi:fructokinase